MLLFRKIFDKTARTASEAFVFEFTGEKDKELIGIAFKFITDVFDRMQPIYRAGLLILAFYFNILFLLFYRGASIGLLKRWQVSRLSLKRDFVNFFMTLSIVAVYDSRKILEREGLDQKTYLKLQCFYNSGVCQ